MSLQTAQNPGDQLYIITQFADQDPDRVATPLVLANCALAADADVVLWLTMDGVELAREGAANKVPGKSFSPLGELLDSFTENGGRIGVCPPCGQSHDLQEQDLISNAEWVGGAALIDLAKNRQTFNF